MSKELKTQLIQHCKSSFLNTIFASFKNNDNACWREIAKTGDYGEHDIQETSRLRM
jgi:hypothetical protein